VLKPGLTRVSLSLFSWPTYLSTPVKWRLPEPFIAQDRVVTMSPKARQLASGQVKSYVVGHNEYE
jgi:hypothetical protein